MIHRTTRTLAGTFAAGILLTGCSGGPAESPATTPSAPPSASADPSAPPSPSSSLSAAEQQAFEEATEVVLAYEQAIYDILASPDPQLNDMNLVAAQPQLAIDLSSLQSIIAAGDTSLTETGPVTLVNAGPMRFNLTANTPSVVLLACVDRSANSGTTAEGPWVGLRQRSQYRVVKTDYLPAPGWAIAKVLPPDGRDQPEPC